MSQKDTSYLESVLPSLAKFRTMRAKLLVQFGLVFLLLSNGINAGAQDYKFHSIFMYNFTKYIQWPSSYQSGEFVIGVLGSSTIVEQLTNMAKVKSAGAQQFEIRIFSDASEVSDCHILFIPEEMSYSFNKVTKKLNGKPTLIISEQAGLADAGSHINFVQVEGKWKFELNQSAAESANLKVSNELSRLAILI